MKAIYKYLTILTVITGVLYLGGCGKEVSQKGWYDYGNGLVNLSNTNLIQGEMSFTLVLNEKDNYGENKKVEIISGPISESNLEKFKREIAKYDGKWNSVTFISMIIFDNFNFKLQGFDDAGITLTDNDSCIQLANLWVSEYNKLLKYLDPYKA